MNRIRAAAAALAIFGLGGTLGLPAAMTSASAGNAPPRLVAIRAAHHPGYDRLVFEFRGGLPAQRSVRYVPTVIADPSGRTVSVTGSARLLVRFFAATGHDSKGHVTHAEVRRTYALPNVIQVVNAGDT